MKLGRFDWDKHFSESKWSEIRENSPFLVDKRLPTLFNHEHGLVYLSSLDVDCSLSDRDCLESSLSDVKSVFQEAVQSKKYFKAAMAVTDFEVLKEQLINLGFKCSELLEP